jgi:hypothetical protein
MRRTWLALTFGALTVACGSAPTSPTPPVVPAAPASAATTNTSTVGPVVRGVVLDELDQPIAGAEVRLNAAGTSRTSLTDAAGGFELPFQIPNGAPAVLVSLTKAGYEPSAGYAWARTSGYPPIRLYRIWGIAAGDSVSLTLFNDGYCGGTFNVACRRVRVKSSSGGTLTARVTPHDGMGVSGGGEPMQASISIEIGPQSETLLDVWGTSDWDGPGKGRTVTLITSVE